MTTPLSASALDELKERQSHPKHRMIHTPEYRRWRCMKTRCLNPHDAAYYRYGGAGIKICDRWLKFESFFADMGYVPEGYQLDRIDSGGNYEPSNCRWVTPQRQQNNRRNNLRLTFNGETLTAADWARRIGIKDNTLCERYRRGWPIERILSGLTRRPPAGAHQPREATTS
jgi:hypothetical protein